jgi:hypothetical protein
MPVLDPDPDEAENSAHHVPIEVVGVEDEADAEALAGATAEATASPYELEAGMVGVMDDDAPLLPLRLVSVMAEPGEFDEDAPIALPDPAHAHFTESGRDGWDAVEGEGWDPRETTDADATEATMAAPADAGSVETQGPETPAANAAPKRSRRSPRVAAIATAPVEAEVHAPIEPVSPAKVAAPRVAKSKPAGKAVAAPKRTGGTLHPLVKVSGAGARGKATPVAPPASCPYCAQLLTPPPETSKRCARCRQRIIVRRVEGRAVYLTEAAVLVFEAERKRRASSGRFERERARWLNLAKAVGAPAIKVERLDRAVLSEETLEAARALYLSNADRVFRAAKRERRWEAAAKIGRERAQALYRDAGSPKPPPADIVALHREASLADLRGVAELARDAQLIGAGCCEACRVDDGLIVKIAKELRETRLPHAGCDRGLCKCRWDLAQKDKDLVARYLRRPARA